MTTKADIYAIWERWAHRTDIGADLDTVWLLTVNRITQRMKAPITVEETDPDFNAMSNMLVHGGLLYIQELAEDDMSIGRESQLFDGAIQAYSIFQSIAAAPVVAMTNPNEPLPETT